MHQCVFSCPPGCKDQSFVKCQNKTEIYNTLYCYAFAMHLFMDKTLWLYGCLII
jgi:hypothetical protein